MDRIDPSPALMLLKRLMDLDKLAGTPGKEWASVKCASKKAYGCGKHGQKLVDGLTLYVRRLEYPYLTSSLSIRLSDEALGIFEAEFGIPRGVLQAKGSVHIANQQFLVLVVEFKLGQHRDCGYYLVYDSTDASLYMVPFLPYDLVTIYTAAPVPGRTADGRGPELVLMACKRFPQVVSQDLLCLCTPAKGVSDSTGAWQIRVQRFVKPSGPFSNDPSISFSANVMFSSQGRVFWGDLLRGVAYCDLRTGDSAVELDFIELPYGYAVPDLEELLEEPTMSRTMGCVGGSVKFISIDRPRAYPCNVMVKVWTLDLEHQEWIQEKGALWKELWELVGLENAEFRDLELQYPVLMPDGALCLLLANVRVSRKGLGKPDYICNFDMHSKRLLSTGRVLNYYHSVYPVILPRDFFTKCKLPTLSSELPTRKRKLHSALQLMVVQQGMN